MAGLLDFFNPPQGGLLGEDDRRRAQQSALMGLAQGLLSAGQPSRMPVGFGAAVGQGLGGYAQAQGDAMNQAVQSKMAGLQFDKANMEMQQAKDKNAAMQRIASRMGPQPYQVADASGNTPAQSFDMASVMRDPSMFGDLVSAYGLPAAYDMTRKQDDTVILPEGSTLARKSDGTPIAHGAPKEDETARLFKMAGVDPNSPEGRQLARAIIERKGRDPSTNVSVTPTIKMGNSIANEVGPLVVASQSAASGAVDTFDTVGRIRAAMGGANMGPGSTIKTVADRIATSFGAGDATTEQRLANTREVVKGLAELTLNGRKALKGQGQVSDYEGRLLERASSGDIDSMTVPELNSLLNVSERIARRNYDNHQKILGTMRSNPDLKDIAPFYDVPNLPGAATKPQPAPASLMKGQTVNGYKYRGGNPSDPNSWEPAN